DDDDDEDVAPDTGMPSGEDDDLVMFDIDECLRGAAPMFSAARPTEITGAIKLDESRIQSSSGYAKLREKPPRFVRG
ncbi:MAG: hypothetical protein ABI551_18520, partial [Polyangiaceae bacterium]